MVKFQENADIATGQILACGAIIRSRLWATTSIEQKEKVFSIIIKASKERTYLGVLANNFIINSFENVSQYIFYFTLNKKSFCIYS